MLRETTPADLDTILHHRRQMFQEMGYGHCVLTGMFELKSRAFFSRALSEGHYQGWLALEDGSVVAGGGVILIEFHPSPSNPDERRPWLVNMYTEPAFRGRKLAASILHAAINWTRHEGYGALFLHASDAARPLYEAAGFRSTNEMSLRL